MFRKWLSQRVRQPRSLRNVDKKAPLKQSSNRLVKTIIRLLFSAGLLFLLCKAVDLNQLARYFLKIKIAWLFIVFFTLLLLRFLVSAKWQIILKHYGIKVPFGELVRVIFIATTLGQVLPAGVGTDIVRGYRLSRKYGRTLGTAATILIDRGVGIFSLFFLAFLGAVVAEIIGIKTSLVWVLGGINLAIVAAWLNIHHLQTMVQKILPVEGRFPKLRKHLMSLVEIVSDKTNINRILPSIFLWSVAIQFFRCCVFFFIYLGFGQSLNFMYFVIFIPIMFVITLIPVSIGGLGVREGVLVVLFSSVGAPAEISIGAGLVSQVLQIFVAAPVLVLWLFEK